MSQSRALRIDINVDMNVSGGSARPRVSPASVSPSTKENVVGSLLFAEARRQQMREQELKRLQSEHAKIVEAAALRRQQLADEQERLRADLESKQSRHAVRRVTRLELLASRAKEHNRLVVTRLRERMIKTFSRRRAARVISKWWKKQKPTEVLARELLTQFHTEGLTVLFPRSKSTSKPMTFASLARKLQNKLVLAGCRAVLVRFIAKQTACGGYVLEKGVERTFLSAFMVCSHPQDIQASEELSTAARNMLTSFDEACRALSTSQPSTSLKLVVGQFRAQWSMYEAAFAAFKNEDASAIVNQLTNTYAKLSATAHDGPRTQRAAQTADEWRDAVSTSLTDLLAKIRKLGGAAAVEKAEVAAVAASTAAAARARLLLSSSSFAAAPPSPPPPSAERSRANSEDVVASSAAATTSLPELSSSSSSSSGVPPASINEALVHELLIAPSVDPMLILSTVCGADVGDDPEGSVDGATAKAPGHRLRMIAERAFWNHFQMLLVSGDNSGLLNALAEIRDLLVDLIPTRHDLHSSLPDIEHFRNGGAIVLPPVLLSLGESIKALQAPSRNSDTTALFARLNDELRLLTADGKMFDMRTPLHAKWVADCVSSLYKKIHQIRRDALAFQVNVIAPHIRSKGILYEREKFASRFSISFDMSASAASNALPKTHRFVRETLVAMRSEAANRSISEVIRSGILRMMCADVAHSRASVPETLELDVSRLVEGQNLLQRECIISCCLVSLQHQLALANVPLRHESAVNLANTLRIILDIKEDVDRASSTVSLANIQVALKQCAMKEASARGSPFASEKLIDVDASIVAALKSLSPVYRLTISRLASAVESLSGVTAPSEISVTLMRASWPLPLQSDGIANIFALLMTVTNYHSLVFDPFYRFFV